MKIVDFYKALPNQTSLLPTNTGFEWWEESYEVAIPEYDREFARKYSDFEYFDFLDENTLANFKADVLSILTFNQKKYAEMYRIFVATDQQMPFDYNYDMEETTGKQKNTFTKGSQSDTVGQRSDTYGQRTDTVGSHTDSHNVAPFNSTTPQIESQDVIGQRSDTIGSHTDTIGSYTDTEGQRVDTSENDAWTLTRKGNIGVQTAGDIARIFTDFWNNHYKFMSMIFEDICKQLLYIGD